ncbi:MAG: MFS transporter, partial [Gemmatimonadetes bacterium]|nr:MFS transporter [Gemmatimonadota bacterium]
DLSIAAAATLGASFAIATAIPQPFFGYLADRFGRRIFAVGGVVTSAVFVSLIGFAPSFWPLLLMLVMGGLGGAAFHPPGASYAVRVGAGRGGGKRYSVFSFGGAVGYAAGPLVAVALVAWGGMKGLWVAMLPAVLFAPVFYRGLPSGRRETRGATPPPTPAAVLRRLAGPLGIIFGISATMAFVQRVFLTMEPIIVADMGGSETLGAAALSVYLGAQAFGTLTGGFLTDRVSRPRLLFHLCAWALPAHLLAVWLGPWTMTGMLAIAAAGFLGMATLPPIVVMAQEMYPRAAGASSGIVMGLAWAVGALGVMVTGAVADVTGPQAAALMSLPVAGLAALLALHPGLKYDDPGA